MAGPGVQVKRCCVRGPDRASDTHRTPEQLWAPLSQQRKYRKPKHSAWVHFIQPFERNQDRRVQINTSHDGGSSVCRLSSTCRGVFIGGCEQTSTVGVIAAQVTTAHCRAVIKKRCSERRVVEARPREEHPNGQQRAEAR